MQVIESIGALIVTLGILVTIHELGHFWVARLCGVKVLRFSVGFGKSIYAWRGKPVAATPVPEGTVVETRTNEPDEGTEFVIAALPLGGYVKMLDEREGFVADDQVHMAFNRKSPWQRMAIAAAGPAANVLLAIVAYWLLFAVGVTGIKPVLGELDPESAGYQAGLREGQQIYAVDAVPVETWTDVRLQMFDRIGDTGTIEVTVGGRDSVSDVSRETVQLRVERWLAGVDEPDPVRDLGLMIAFPDIPPVIAGLVDGEPAKAAGFVPGDRVTGVQGQAVATWGDWVELVQQNPDTPIDVTVLRDGVEHTVRVTPRGRELEGRTTGYVGASRHGIEFPPDMLVQVRHPLWYAWIPATEKTWTVTVFTLKSIKKMIVGAISPKNLSGPITIAQIAGTTAKSGLEDFVGFIALLSISLAVLNLLPIPVLDGGHILYSAAEILLRRPVPERVQIWGMQLGVFLVVSIMLLAIYNDIARFVLRG